MTLTLTPELEQRVRQEAARHGQDADAYALSLLQTALPADYDYHAATPAERAQAYLDWANSHPVNPSAPLLSDEALRRENMYED